MKTKGEFIRFSGLFLAGSLLSISVLAAPITYSVSSSIGSISISGTLTTDGTIGPLVAANFTDFSLTVTDGSNPTTYTPLNAFVSPGNSFGVVASATGLSFNTFGAITIFTPPPGDGGLYVWRLADSFEEIQNPDVFPSYIARVERQAPSPFATVVQPPDDDGDGVLNEADACPQTNLAADAAKPPLRWLQYLYWTSSDGRFVDVRGRDSGFTVVNTHGCSASQIVNRLANGTTYERYEAWFASRHGLSKLRLWLSAK